MQSYKNIIKDGQSDNLGIAIQSLIMDNIKNLNTCFIAKVESVSDNKVSVSDVILNKEGESNQIINNVLVAQPFSKAGLFFNVDIGDYGFCVVCKKDISTFKQNGYVSVKNTDRIFDTIDSIFIPCSLFNQTNFNGKVGNGSGLYFTNDDLITLKNQNTTLKTIIVNLIDILTSLTTTNAVVGSPCSLNPVTIQQLNTFKTNLDLFFKE